MKYLTSLTAAALLLAGAAHATPMNVTGTPQGDSFTSFAGPGPGTHGLETRGGGGSWELGLGTATSQSGGFNQAEWSWDDATLDAGQWAFEYDYNAGTSELRMWDALTGTRPVAATLSFSGMSQGNAVEIFAKRQAEINITELDGHAFNLTVGDITTGGNDTARFYSEDFLDGFVMKGTLDILSGGNSAREVFVKAGNVDAPVPLPAALPLLAAGLGGLAMVRRRRG